MAQKHILIICGEPSGDLQAANLAKASGTAGKETIGTVTRKQIEEIARLKAKDLNTQDINEAVKIITGTARSMGISVED